MFDINIYNLEVAYFLFFFFMFFNIILFHDRLSSLCDPLIYHLVWISTVISFLFVYVIKYGLSSSWFFFFLCILFYLIFLYFLHPKVFTRVHKDSQDKTVFTSYKLLVILLLIFIYSKKDMFLYFLNNDIYMWPLYRYQDLQGRDVLSRILSTGFSQIFIYVIFLNLFFTNKFKILTMMLLFFYVSLGLVAGGRSTMLTVILSFGGFFYVHYQSLKEKKYKINFSVIVLLSISILMVVLVSGLLLGDVNKGIGIFVNRFFANADGIEYFIRYDGFNALSSGVKPYLESVFGIYINQLFPVEIKNVGWQLSELVYGHELNFAQGANYSLGLQVAVLGYYFLPVYLIIIVLIIRFLRSSTVFFSGNYSGLIAFLLSFNAYTITTDVEYFVFKFISILICFVLLFFITYLFKVYKW